MTTVNDSYLDIVEDTSAERIGRRIRDIRVFRGMTQGELGNLIDLSADRVQKYENGFRKPKIELLNRIAAVLDVSIMALLDPVPGNYIGAMYSLFEMENFYGLKLQKEGDRVSFTLGEAFKMDYIEAWFEKQKETEERLKKSITVDEREEIIRDYKQWKWTFPDTVIFNEEISLKEKRKAELEAQISEMQKELSLLNSENS